MCRNYVHTILIGCWTFTGVGKISRMHSRLATLRHSMLTVLCFAIALGIMAFIPRPLETFPGEEEGDVPPSPASFGTGSPMDEERHTSFYSIDSRTGLVTYNDQGAHLDTAFSSDSDSTPVSRTHQATIVEGLPRYLQGLYDSPTLRRSHSDSTNGGTISRGDTPRDRISVVSRPQWVELFQSDPFQDPTSPPTSINSQASMIRTGVGGEISPLSKDRPNSTLSLISLRDPPALVATQRDRSTLYPIHHHSLSAPFESDSKPEQASPDHLQAITPGAYSFHSLAASVHSKWAEPTSHTVPPLALMPGIAHFHEPLSFWGGLTSPTYVAPFGARGSKPGLMRTISDPTGTMRHISVDVVRQPADLHVKDSPFPRRGSDGQVWDRAQWQRLVLSAAGKS
jgi:hypothetical protein